MTSRHFVVIAAAALVAIAAAFWATSTREPGDGIEPSGVLVPGLKEAINDIERVTVQTASETTAVTLVRADNRWTVAEAFDYPADTGKIRKLLLAFADADRIEAKTANPDNYSVLGVEDVSSESATGRRVTLDGLSTPASIIVGNRPTRGGTYVRIPGENQSWLVDESITVAERPNEWLDKRLTDIQKSTLQRVVITHPDGEVVELERAGRSDADLVLANVPEGREYRGPSAANSVTTALASLNYDDVLPATEFDPADAEPTTASFYLFDGTRLDVTAYKIDDAHHLRFAAAFDEAQAERFAPGNVPFGDGTAAADDGASPSDPADEESPPADTAAAPSAADAAAPADTEIAPPDFTGAIERVEALTARFDGWVYRVPAYKYNAFTKRLDDLLKPVEDDN